MTDCNETGCPVCTGPMIGRKPVVEARHYEQAIAAAERKNEILRGYLGYQTARGAIEEIKRLARELAEQEAQ